MFKKIMLVLLTVVLALACCSMIACKKTVYTVTFDTDGGTSVAVQKITEGEKATKPVDPTKTGYEFDDWYLADEQTPFDFENTSINKNITLTAKWDINQYSISFNSDGGSAVATITQDFGTQISAPTDPTRTGYSFTGWFEDEALTAYDFDTIEARNVELTARWTINQYSITFNTDGGSPEIATITEDYGTVVSAPTTAVTKVGYTFTGWYEQNSIIPYQFNTIEARNVELRAGWSVNSYTIIFDTNGGTPSTISPITQNYGTAVSAPTPPTKIGYTFAGWYEDGASTAYGFDTIEARNVELKAKWDINQYSISFDSDGGSAVAPITQNYGTAVSAPTPPTKTGYNFLGWFEGNSANAYVFNTIEARNVELTARWGEKAQYSISFDSDGGSIVETIIERAETPISAPTPPTKTGYTFEGWFEDGSLTAYVFNVVEERNVELKAKWTINQYSISFNSDGGSILENITENYGTQISAPANPTKDGYTFLGWFEQDSITPYIFNTIEARNVELTAKWAENRGVITLDKGLQGQVVNGLTQATITPYIGQEIVLSELECWGYEFLGWKNMTTNAMLEKVDGEYVIVHDGSDVTYQAQWQKTSVDSDIV